jgi:hypothetical protein
LYWYSPSQPEEIIPTPCLYPTNSLAQQFQRAAVVTSALSAVAFLGQPFSFTVTGANTPLGFTASGLPPGLSFNNTNGVIAGVPTLAGNFQVTLTASNAVGVGASVVNISVLNTGSSVVQEIWTNVPGINVATSRPARRRISRTCWARSKASVNYGDNYGERIRGYFTAPVTGNYYFWIAGSDSAQLWISDDNNQVNQVLRAWVTPTNNPTAPGQNGTSRASGICKSASKSGWLSLVAGQQYYIEILHKAGVGTNDNWSVGWLQDPTGTNNTPAPAWCRVICCRAIIRRCRQQLRHALLRQPAGAARRRQRGRRLGHVARQRRRHAGHLEFHHHQPGGNPTGQSINSDPYLNDPGRTDL